MILTNRDHGARALIPPGRNDPARDRQTPIYQTLTKTGEGKAGVKFYVVELGGSGSYAREEIQTVTVTLGAPVDHNGDPVKIYRGSAQMP